LCIDSLDVPAWFAMARELPRNKWKVKPMCLAIPGKIVQELDGGRIARVQFGGVTRQVHLDFVPGAHCGDYVMVHVGFAISKVEAAEAERTYALLRQIGALAQEGIGESEPEEPQ
jgi:hydrogenase expression/formation protein HypC